MNEKDSEAPFPREPWKRLLEVSDEGPPETTDARIRAAARRDLVPRGRRWWLPASLAASFVLAVLVVRSEFGAIRKPLVDESDNGEAVAIHGRIVDREKAQEPRAPGASPKASAKTDLPPAAETEDDDFGAEDSKFAADAGGASPRVGGPEIEVQAASEIPEVEVTAHEMPAAGMTANTPVTSVTSSDAAAAAMDDSTDGKSLGNVVVTGSRATATPPTPEAWYAAIEALRKSGRNAEADAELARFEAAYPDWIKKHHRKRP